MKIDTAENYKLQEITQHKGGHKQFTLTFPPRIYEEQNLEKKFINFKLSDEPNSMDLIILIEDKDDEDKLYKVNKRTTGALRITIPRNIVNLMGYKKSNLFRYEVRYSKQYKKDIIYLRFIPKR